MEMECISIYRATDTRIGIWCPVAVLVDTKVATNLATKYNEFQRTQTTQSQLRPVGKMCRKPNQDRRKVISLIPND